MSQLLGGAWHEDDLWICAVRQHDLRRVVIGRDQSAPLPAAVCASCAVPGYFRLVRIGDRNHIDGGVRSPTNADVLRRRDVDLAVVISPMSGRDLGRFGPGNLIRQRAHRQVERERERLREAGIPCVLIEPGPDVVQELGVDPISDANLRAIVRAPFLDTGDELRAPISGHSSTG